MINTAKVIEVDQSSEGITLFDIVTLYNEKLGQEKKIQLVTTIRQNALLGFVSKESPLGQALLGHKEGDRVEVKVNDSMSYFVKILKVEAGEDNEDLPISSY
jgi:transcription elongation factor GreA